MNLVIFSYCSFRGLDNQVKSSPGIQSAYSYEFSDTAIFYRLVIYTRRSVCGNVSKQECLVGEFIRDELPRYFSLAQDKVSVAASLFESRVEMCKRCHTSANQLHNTVFQVVFV